MNPWCLRGAVVGREVQAKALQAKSGPQRKSRQKTSCPHSAAEAGSGQEVNPLHCQDSVLNAPVRRTGHERPS